MHLADDIAGRKGRREAIAAPRGYAKSTIKSLLLPIHSLVYETERYIVIISATLKQAKQRLKNIKEELLTNQRLIDYYDLPIPKNPSRSWTQRQISLGEIQVEVYSAGTEMRGISHGPWRPTRIILDDAEDSTRVENSEGRDKLMEWFNEVVEHLGDTYTVIDIIGTLLHPESLLATLLRRPDFKGRVYRSVIDFADNGDLWEKWRRLYTNLSDTERSQTAEDFFRKNRNAMLKGSRVLWSAREDYYNLMIQMVTQGRAAFFQEKQNEPRAAEHRIFSRERLRFFSMEGDRIFVERPGADSKIVFLKDLCICGFLDAAMGKSRRGSEGDFAAIVTVGRDDDGYIYVLDAWLRRIAPTGQINRIFENHERFCYARFGIEANCFQSLMMLPLEEERRKRRDRGEAWDVPVTEVVSRRKKEARIMSLEPLASNGWLLFNRSLPEEFYRQLEDVPRGKHDDGPDALAAAVELVNGFNKITPSQKSPGTRKSKSPLRYF